MKPWNPNEQAVESQMQSTEAQKGIAEYKKDREFQKNSDEMARAMVMALNNAVKQNN